jgi:hypothetical protein
VIAFATGIEFATGIAFAAVFDVSCILIVWPLWRVCHLVAFHDLAVAGRGVFFIVIDALLIRFDGLIVFEVLLEVEVAFDGLIALKVTFEVEVLFEVEVGK